MESPIDSEDQYAGLGRELLVRHGGLGDLSGDVGTVLTDAQGNVNAGSGVQVNFHVLERSGSYCWTSQISTSRASQNVRLSW